MSTTDLSLWEKHLLFLSAANFLLQNDQRLDGAERSFLMKLATELGLHAGDPRQLMALIEGRKNTLYSAELAMLDDHHRVEVVHLLVKILEIDGQRLQAERELLGETMEALGCGQYDFKEFAERLAARDRSLPAGSAISERHRLLAFIAGLRMGTRDGTLDMKEFKLLSQVFGNQKISLFDSTSRRGALCLVFERYLLDPGFRALPEGFLITFCTELSSDFSEQQGPQLLTYVANLLLSQGHEVDIGNESLEKLGRIMNWNSDQEFAAVQVGRTLMMPGPNQVPPGPLLTLFGLLAMDGAGKILDRSVISKMVSKLNYSTISPEARGPFLQVLVDATCLDQVARDTEVFLLDDVLRDMGFTDAEVSDAFRRASRQKNVKMDAPVKINYSKKRTG